MSRRRALIIVGVVLLVTGCGQTDFATSVGQTSATLNGTITTYTEGEQTSFHFEYWKTFDSAVRHRTPDQTVTGTGPISETVTPLAPDTHYSYRLCGTEGDSPVVCAQTRTFATGRDSVQAYGKTILYVSGGREWLNGIDVDALKGAPGEPPLGRAFFLWGRGVLGASSETPVGSHSGPNVTCLEVQGDEAIIGVRDDLDSDSSFPEQSFVRAVDGGPLGSGLDRFELFPWYDGNDPRSPTDCFSPLPEAEITLERGEVAVNDVP